MIKLPNLELIEYKARMYLSNDNTFKDKLIELKSKQSHIYVEFDIDLFSQVWGSTCTGFDITSDGHPAIGGDAMTKEYTTVLREVNTNTYVVFFGDRPAYAVYGTNERFLNDLKEHNLASMSEAAISY